MVQLLGAVERLLDRGETYASISVGTLSDEAGISRSTFYGYFADKGELLEELAADVIVAVREDAARLWALPRDAGRDDVRDAAARVVERYRRHAILLAAVVDAGATEPSIRRRYNTTVDLAGDELAAHIRRGRAEGWIAPEIDESAATWLVWMVERAMYRLFDRDHPPSDERLTEDLTAIVWRTLYAGYR